MQFSKYSLQLEIRKRKTIRSIIYEVCGVLWKILSVVYVSEPTLPELITTADDFWQTLNIGAIDGKHMALTNPPNAGPQFFNYEKFHSIVL